MSADRFEINTDDGIFIQHPFAANMTVPQMFEGAIRQQARDIAELLEQLAEANAATADQRASMTQHADELYAGIAVLCDELGQLRVDLAAVTAERDRLTLPSALKEKLASAERRIAELEKTECSALKLRAEQAEAQLAEYADAPTVAYVATPVAKASGRDMIAAVQPELGPALGLAPARADAEIAELRRDAERYRWLRANATRKLGAELFGQPSPSYIDKAIDAARGGE